MHHRLFDQIISHIPQQLRSDHIQLFHFLFDLAHYVKDGQRNIDHSATRAIDEAASNYDNLHTSSSLPRQPTTPIQHTLRLTDPTHQAASDSFLTPITAQWRSHVGHDGALHQCAALDCETRCSPDRDGIALDMRRSLDLSALRRDQQQSWRRRRRRGADDDLSESFLKKKKPKTQNSDAVASSIAEDLDYIPPLPAPIPRRHIRLNPTTSRPVSRNATPGPSSFLDHLPSHNARSWTSQTNDHYACPNESGRPTTQLSRQNGLQYRPFGAKKKFQMEFSIPFHPSSQQNSSHDITSSLRGTSSTDTWSPVLLSTHLQETSQAAPPPPELQEPPVPVPHESLFMDIYSRRNLPPTCEDATMSSGHCNAWLDTTKKESFRSNANHTHTE
ncbi:hypothetical protein BT69DRAFT_1316566 [Atractiella rhizophila]|nr:hypothetical protein BT69DRAFT_1316566 [Atractiella rhizophila]